MSAEDQASSLLARLQALGRPSDSPTHRTLHYAEDVGLTIDDVPELIRIARAWAESMEDVVEGPEIYAPVHAWRALGQLGAVDAVQPLLDMLDPLRAEADDWSLDEFPEVLGLIGRPALPAVSAYVADPAHHDYSRACASDSLASIGRLHPETRSEAVAGICRALSAHEQNDPELNGLFVSSLLDLGAYEAAEVIERAYAAGCVSPGICGDWHWVRAELGVEGLGLVPDEPEPSPPFMGFARPPDDPPRTKSQRSGRAKSKRARKARAQNRKRKKRR